MKRKNILFMLLSMSLLLPGCGAAVTGSGGTSDVTPDSMETSTSVSDRVDSTTTSEAADGESTAIAVVQDGLDTSSMFTERDLEVGYDEDAAVNITLSDDRTECSSDAVEIEGNTISITDEGTYIFTGTLSDGQILVEAEDSDKVQIVLDGVNITSKTSAAIYVKQADKVFVTTAAGSENTLENGGTYEAIDDNAIDAVIFSKEDLTLNGQGTLTISAASGHGVVSKDDLAVTSGTYQITAASHGLSGKNSVRIAGGSFAITAGKDGIHAEHAEDTEKGFVYIADGDFSVKADGDGISASSILQIEDGTFDITAGGGSTNAAAHTSDMPFGGPGGSFGDGTMKNDENGERPQMPGEAGVGNGERPQMPDEAGAGNGERPQMPDEAGAGNGEPPQMSDGTDAGNDGTTDTDEESTAVSTKGLKAELELLIFDGNYSIDAADDALHTNGDMTISGGTFRIRTGDDGAHADNALTIYDGTIEIAESYEGLEGLTIEVNGGAITVTASDDGMNAAGGNDASGSVGGDMFAVTEGACITINSGVLTVNADGDGLDSNGDLIVNGGELYVNGPENGGNGALDYSGTAAVNGGIIVATGYAQMAQNFGDTSTQASMLATVDTKEAGSDIIVTDQSGNVILTYQATKSFNSVLVSTPDLQEGETYTLITGEDSTEIVTK